jgi:hypothetical protein
MITCCRGQKPELLS